jgi:hypothetical protein
LGSRGISSRSIANLFLLVSLFSLFSMVPMVIFLFKNSYH